MNRRDALKSMVAWSFIPLGSTVLTTKDYENQLIFDGRKITYDGFEVIIKPPDASFLEGGTIGIKKRLNDNWYGAWTRVEGITPVLPVLEFLIERFSHLDEGVGPPETRYEG